MVAGDSDCTTGLSKRIYDTWTADTDNNGLVVPLSDTADNAVKSLCYAIATSVVAEITTNAKAIITTNDDGLQQDPELKVDTTAPVVQKELGIE